MGLEKELIQANRYFSWAMHELEAVRVGHAIVESDASIVKEARQMLQCQLDLYMDKNQELTRELKAAH